MAKETSLRIGRLDKRKLEALGLSLAFDPSLHLGAEVLSRLVETDPDGYLKRIELIKRIVHDPDYLTCQGKQCVGFAKYFPLEDGGSMFVCFFELIGKPKRYFLTRFRLSSGSSLTDSSGWQRSEALLVKRQSRIDPNVKEDQ